MGPASYMIFKMWPENFFHRIFNFPLYCIHIDLAPQITLAEVSDILNFIYGAAVDEEIKGKLNLASTDTVLALHMHHIKQSTQ